MYRLQKGKKLIWKKKEQQPLYSNVFMIEMQSKEWIPKVNPEYNINIPITYNGPSQLLLTVFNNMIQN
jgi:hypothetical protein